MTGTVQCGYPLILGTEQLGPGCLPGLCATASNATPRLLSLQTIIPALHTPPQTTPVVVTLSLIISWLDMCGSNPVFRVAGGYLLVNGKPTVSPITLLDFPLRSLQLGSTCHRTTWYPVEASSTAAPNGFTTTRRLSATNRPSDITDNAAAATGRALLAIFISPVVLGGFVILCITGSIAHCWRQRGRRKLYGPMSAYYRTQRAELYDGPYQANANPGAFGSASPQFPPSTHPSSQAFSPLRASVMPSPQTSPHK
ncbi:hypothetical protein M408DRAFT_30103 [Serendipita vermifera MAFF 305830]|uniref:Uncharacterized protein n=1 Tax=Serendipita vermifera MAFF 305830 TaxID=933852 RepID=A0A0C3AND9_SERVB|nr:hypothetical protein M408DRAFT_30103 [Serendipita vermifera MAFF 305830]